MHYSRLLGRKGFRHEHLEHRLLLTSSTSPAFEFARLEPVGGLAFASLANVGLIADPASDKIDFTFTIEAGEAVSALATPDNAGAVLSVQFLDADGIVATYSASIVGDAASLPYTQLASDGLATVRVMSTVPTTFNLDIYRNVQLESVELESLTGDTSSDSALELVATEIDGFPRFAALGSTSLVRSESIVFADSFVDSTAFSLNGLWHVSSGRSSDGRPNHDGRGVYFGHGEVASSPNDDLDFVRGSYDTGTRVSGDAVSPPFSLNGDSDFTLTFRTLVEVEDAEDPFELMQVLVRDVATLEDEILLDRFDGTLPVDTLGEWIEAEIDLSPFRGQIVQVVFRFDSVDENRNNFEGWWIDEVLVTRSVQPSVDVDQYEVDLSEYVGETVDILLAGHSREANIQSLELRAPTGALLATGSADSNQNGVQTSDYDLGIVGYPLTVPGRYTIRVISDTTSANEEYGLVVAPGLAIENEPNELTDTLVVFDSEELTYSGHLRSNAIRTYDSRGAFDADNPDLKHEDFENGRIGASDLLTFAGPLSSQTANVAFPDGITPGATLSVSDGDLALVGPAFFDPEIATSQAVGPDRFAANTNVTYSPPQTAVGLDILGNAEVDVRLYDSSNRLIQSTVVHSTPSGTFFGVVSSQAISRLELVETIPSGELIDNLAFGSAGVSTTPDEDAFVLSLEADQTVQVTTSTPLDSDIHGGLPVNTLDPRLSITGPGVNLTDADSTDGKNAFIQFTATIAGDYIVEIDAQSGAGEYLVHVAPPHLRGFLNADGFIVLEANELDSEGLDFRSTGGFLVPNTNADADPFEFALSNTVHRITYGNLGSAVRLDGRLVTNVRYVGDNVESDLNAFYRRDSVEVPFSVVASDPMNVEPLDCNKDGAVDAEDLTCICTANAVDDLLATLAIPLGDIDGDGRVNFPDFLGLARSFGEADSRYVDGDLDCSGTVDFVDFLILSRNFGA